MNKLKEKLKKNGGFTMVELLIVVAIIGILAAVSIPLFNNALEKARHGVDAANARSAISLANAQAIASLDPKTEFATAKVFYYTVDDTDHQGALVETKPTGTVAVMPKCTCFSGTAQTLAVKITYNDAAADPLKQFTVETNWTFDSGSGKITACTDFSAP